MSKVNYISIDLPYDIHALRHQPHTDLNVLPLFVSDVSIRIHFVDSLAEALPQKIYEANDHVDQKPGFLSDKVLLGARAIEVRSQCHH